MWHDILATNRATVQELLDRCIGRLRDLPDLVGDEAMSERFAAAAATRASAPLTGKGFLTPLHDILVVAPDEPGVLARMATALAAEDINIKDIEVLKVREGEGASIRLAFGDRDAATRAVELVAALGYRVWAR